MLYPISEIFYSIQGEGRNTGMPAWFIRFAGCNLNCPWCDTNHSQKIERKESYILNAIKSNSCQNVILTGGEPTIHNLKPLLLLLKENHYYVAIETNGTNDLLKYRIEALLSWVTVSPKSLPIAVGCKVEEIKVVWPSELDLKQAEEVPADYYYLQPRDEKGVSHSKDNLLKTMSMVMNNPRWRLSLQTQKMIGLR